MESYYGELGLMPDKMTGERKREFLLAHELKLQELTKLGQGMFGHVYAARCPPPPKKWHEAVAERKPEDDKTIACKLSDYDEEFFKEIQWKCFIDEVKAFRAINSRKHPHIVAFESDFHMFVQDTDYVEINWRGVAIDKEVKLERNTNNLVEEHGYHQVVMSGIIIEKLDMNLDQWMEANKLTVLNEEQGTQLFCDIGSALQFLHRDHLIAHRDIKSDNIGVIGPILPGGSMPTLKLYDFGLARFYPKAEYDKAEQKSDLFRMHHDHTDLKITNDPLYAGNAFIFDSYMFSRVIMTIMTVKNFLDQNGYFKHFKDDRFRKIVLAMCTENLTINAALERYKFDFW